MIIRTSNESDFDNIFTLLEQLWADAVLDKSKFKDTFLSTLNSDSNFAFCAEKDGNIIGFITGDKFIDYWNTGYSCHVTILIVDENHRGNNIGTALLDKVSEWSITNNCKAIELNSSFHRITAHTFYEKYGFNKRAFAFSMDINK